MNWFEAASPEAEAALRQIEARRRSTNDEALRVADEMIAGVRAGGDAFVARQIERFDRVSISPDAIAMSVRDTSIDADLAAALDLAIERVEAFHLAQMPSSYTWNGVTHRVRALRRVGVYVPGGRAVYVSTLIMCAVPARIAGVEEIVVATPPSVADRDELH
jgi:histidinol dehydrogenase